MAKRTSVKRFVVKLRLPEGARVSDAQEYIETCVRSWHGSLFPGNDFEPPDPMWDLDPDTVKVSIYRVEKVS